MAKSIVGLDIGSNSIRAVEVADATGNKPRVLRYREVPIPDGAAVSGDVIELHTIAAAIRSLWGTGGFTSKNVVLGMGNQRVLARDFTVPKMSMLQIRESLPFQVQDLLPVPVADAILDFYPVSESMGENGPVINGLLVAAVKEAVLANVKAAELAGLNPVGMDLIPFALTRVHLRDNSSRAAVALIDIGATTTNVIIAKGATPQFVRIIPAGSDDITKALITKFQISPHEAEQAKRLLGLDVVNAAAAQRPVIEAIYEAAMQLLTSLRNTLNYYANAHQQDPISRIILTGGGSRLIGLDRVLGELTHLPVNAEDGFTNVQLSRGVKRADAADRSSMSVALGLALGSKA
jgi:type IV pilus assembly protein PilM